MGSAIASLTGKTAAPTSAPSRSGAIGSLIAAGPAYHAQLDATVSSKPVDPNTLADTKALNAALSAKQITQQQYADRFNTLNNKPVAAPYSAKNTLTSLQHGAAEAFGINATRAGVSDLGKQSVQLGKQLLAKPASAQERQAIITNQAGAATSKEYQQATKGLKLNNSAQGTIQAQRMAAQGAKAPEI